MPPSSRLALSLKPIFASRALSPSALPALTSLARSVMASRSSSVKTLDPLALAVVLFADFCVTIFAGFVTGISVATTGNSDQGGQTFARIEPQHGCPLDWPEGDPSRDLVVGLGT